MTSNVRFLKNEGTSEKEPKSKSEEVQIAPSVKTRVTNSTKMYKQLQSRKPGKAMLPSENGSLAQMRQDKKNINSGGKRKLTIRVMKKEYEGHGAKYFKANNNTYTARAEKLPSMQLNN